MVSEKKQTDWGHELPIMRSLYSYFAKNAPPCSAEVKKHVEW
jgi:hypothetical protein